MRDPTAGQSVQYGRRNTENRTKPTIRPQGGRNLPVDAAVTTANPLDTLAEIPKQGRFGREKDKDVGG